jgi:phage host-nuclease inhibitor protein Gam
MPSKTIGKQKKRIHLGRVIKELRRVRTELEAYKKRLEGAEKKAIDLKIEGVKRLFDLMDDFCKEHEGKLGDLGKFGFRPGRGRD